MTLTLEQAQTMMDRNDGWLWLSGTQITTLPDNLTVGGSLDLSGTRISSLPDNLTVGGSLDLSGTQINNRKAYKRLEHGDYVPGKFLYADGILTHIKSCHKVGEYTFYVGKIKGHNVISDGINYAHCNKLRDGVAKSEAYVDFTQGLDARLLTPEKIIALNGVKVKMLHFAWDLMEQSDAVLRGLELYSKQGAVQDERKRRVYVLTNFNTTEEEDLYRIYHLREMGYDPYVMIFDKEHAPRQKKRLQRWVNNKFIWRSCERFEDYNEK